MPVSGNTGTTTPAATQETSAWFVTVDAHNTSGNNASGTMNYLPNNIDSYSLPESITVAAVSFGLEVPHHTGQLNPSDICKVELTNTSTEDIYIWVTLIPIFTNGTATSRMTFSDITDGAVNLVDTSFDVGFPVNGAVNPATNPRTGGYIPRWTQCRRVGPGASIGMRCYLTTTGGIRVANNDPFLVLASATIDDWIRHATQGVL